MATGRLSDAASLVFGSMRARRRAKKVAIGLVVLSMFVGAGMFAYPYATDVYSNFQQGELADEFASPQFEARFAAGKIEAGQVLTRIEIPKLKVNALIVEGTETKALRAGAGHYSRTPKPCQPGNVGIAGHRTTFGKPFNRIDELKAGDTIILHLPDKAKCTYRVVEGARGAPRPRAGSAAWVTLPSDYAVLNKLPGSMLTLTTCHPKGSAKERLVLRAELVSA
ncbi:MAG: sortase [Actinomycetota bacterium]